MKKFIYTLFAAAATMTMVNSCNFSDFGDINLNPNQPSTEFTTMLFANACLEVPVFVFNGTTYDIWTQCWPGYLSESKNNQFGSLGTTKNFGTASYYYYYMKECNEVIKLNSDDDTKDASNVTVLGAAGNQIAAATTLKAFYMMHLTDIVGPLPYSEAWRGESDDIWYPKFDSVKDIYTALNNELESTYSLFDESGDFSSTYDLIYHGDVAKWKKLNATLRMMMAIKLADVDPSTGKTRFAKAYSDGGMEDVEDSMVWTYDDKYRSSGMYYQGNKGYAAAANNFVPNKVIVEALKEYKDPRLFEYTTLDGYKGLVKGDPKDFNAYKGVPFGLESNDAVIAAAAGCCSVADKYCELTATVGVITTARCLLVEAEAAKLGWISASAEDLYYAGIEASFEFEGASGYADYIKGDKVKWADSMEQIIMQRWLAGFMTDGVEAWSDWRRYNIPVIPMEQEHKNQGIATYPYRMTYGDNDRQYNQDNYDAIVASEFGGKDDRWSRLWWDVADNV